MASKTTLVVPADTPAISPNLMPFHIAYSGPAPISTYLLKRQYIETREGEIKGPNFEGTSEKARPGLAKSGLSGVMDALEMKDEEKEGKSVAGEKKDTSATEEKAMGLSNQLSSVDQKDDTRLEAAFRGRRIISEDVFLPQGFTGVLLAQQGDDPTAKSRSTKKATGNKDARGSGKLKEKAKDAKGKAEERAKALKAKAAAKLKGKKSRYGDDQEDEQEELEQEDQPLDLAIADVSSGPKGETREFTVGGRFDKFRIWYPDAPMDEGRDEYIRSLQEWMVLANEINRV